SFHIVYAQTTLKTGIWRGATITATGVEIPFNFEVANVAGKQKLTIMNGSERIKVTAVTHQGDSIFIKMPLFDSEFRLKLSGDNLAGKWIRNLGNKFVAMDFKATPNTAWRFKAPKKPLYNIT